MGSDLPGGSTGIIVEPPRSGGFDEDDASLGD